MYYSELSTSEACATKKLPHQQRNVDHVRNVRTYFYCIEPDFSYETEWGSTENSLTIVLHKS